MLPCGEILIKHSWLEYYTDNYMSLLIVSNQEALGVHLYLFILIISQDSFECICVLCMQLNVWMRTFCLYVGKNPQEGKLNNRYQRPSLLRQGAITPMQVINSPRDSAITLHPSPESVRETGEFMEHLEARCCRFIWRGVSACQRGRVHFPTSH